MAVLVGKRVAIYARFSSDNQREASIADQLRRCSEFVQRAGGSVDPSLVFSDAAVSGATLDRPDFERLMAAVDARKVDAIVAEDMSRISRDFADAAHVFRKLQFLEVQLLGVEDGVDSSSKNAKLTFTMASVFHDLYLETLSDKTKRGQEGRWLAGFSTGAPPLGYRSEPVRDPTGRVIGYRIEIDPIASQVVLRIFDLYLQGQSCDTIAKTLNTEHVDPPRAKTRHRRKGWVASSIKDILANEAYIGIWVWRKRAWARVPGTKKRRPRRRDPKEILRQEFPERRIVPQDLWDQVRTRAAAVRARYAGKRNTKTAPGNRTAYPLSGLLECGLCGAPMTIHGGSSANYYYCSDYKKRGTCANGVPVREDTARAGILGALRESLFTPSAVEYLRKRIAEHLGSVERSTRSELKEHADRLARTEQRIHGLVRFIADGDDSQYVRGALKDLEAQAKTERTAISSLKEQASAPVVLPTPERVLLRAQELDRVFRGDPLRARESLRRYFEDGRIKLYPQPDRTYLADCTFLPLVALAEMARPLREEGSRGTAGGCAGRI